TPAVHHVAQRRAVGSLRAGQAPLAAGPAAGLGRAPGRRGGPVGLQGRRSESGPLGGGRPRGSRRRPAAAAGRHSGGRPGGGVGGARLPAGAAGAAAGLGGEGGGADGAAVRGLPRLPGPAGDGGPTAWGAGLRGGVLPATAVVAGGGGALAVERPRAGAGAV